MILGLIVGIALLLIFIRAIAYGIYCIKATGIVSGISIFFLAACVAAAAYMLLFADKNLT